MRHHRWIVGSRARHRKRWSLALIAAAALIAISGCGWVDEAEARTKPRRAATLVPAARKPSRKPPHGEVYDNEMEDLDVDEFESTVLHPSVHHCELDGA